MISVQRMAEIIADMNTRKINREPRNYDNFSALQNLGHEETAGEDESMFDRLGI